MSGIQASIFTAMMAHAAVLHARREIAALGSLVVRTTQLAVGLLLGTGLPILIFGVVIIKTWVGARYSFEGHHLLTILIVANIIRLIGTPYAVVLVATGQQKLVVISPLAEGLINLVASVILGSKFGAVGVATGTLLGGIIGMLGHLIYNIPRTQEEVGLSTKTYLARGVGWPLLAFLPLSLMAFYSLTRGTVSSWSVIGSFCVSLAAFSILLVHGASPLQREVPSSH